MSPRAYQRQVRSPQAHQQVPPLRACFSSRTRGSGPPSSALAFSIPPSSKRSPPVPYQIQAALLFWWEIGHWDLRYPQLLIGWQPRPPVFRLQLYSSRAVRARPTCLDLDSSSPAPAYLLHLHWINLKFIFHPDARRERSRLRGLCL